jgi:poly(U)-specific endoribonuclease
VVTISHEWNAFDYENGGSTKLIKPTGGFMVGCSPEGLIALGLVAFFDPRTRKSIEINNSKYDVKLFKAGPEESSINTFYLIFSGFTVIPVVDDEPKEDEDDTANVVIPTSSSDVRIIAALINPEGDDTGKETLTLINVSNSPRDLRGWNLSGANGKAFELVDAKLDAGEARQFRLPANSAELTNKSAKITLKDAEKNVIHIVEYSKKDIKSGYTTVF